METTSVLSKAREKLIDMVKDHNLTGERVNVTIGTLSADQSIGSPVRPDFALLGGKEVMIEAEFKGSFGQAFTSQPQNYEGSLEEIINLNLDSFNNRAIFSATLNAVMAYLGKISGMRHCRNDEPEKCAAEIAGSLLKEFGRVKVGLVGYQPAILSHLVEHFGADNVKCSDLTTANIGSYKSGVQILDGQAENMNLVSWCDLLLVTSSTVVNSTFDQLQELCKSQGKKLIVFGVTGAGISALFDLRRLCPFAH